MEQAQPSKTWAVDFTTGGTAGMTDGIAALRQAACLMLQTERFRHLIYSRNYGSELGALVGRDFAYVKAAAPGMIDECLRQDERFLSTGDFAFEDRGESILISFTVETNEGNFESEVEL